MATATMIVRKGSSRSGISFQILRVVFVAEHQAETPANEVNLLVGCRVLPFYSSLFCLLWSNNLMFHFIIHGSLVEIPTFFKSTRTTA